MRTRCTEGEVTTRNPPLLFDLNNDPYENFPLDTTLYPNLLAKINEIITIHRRTIETVPDQIGEISPHVPPCCQYPLCECDYLNPIL